MSTPPTIPLPEPDPWLPHSYFATGMGGGCVNMNDFERERSHQRPWYRRFWGMPSQAEVDSWGLKRPDRASTSWGDPKMEANDRSGS